MNAVNRREFLKWSAVGAAALALPRWFCAAEPAARKPNIIVIYTDDHGYADLGAQGVVKDIKTANIDTLVKNGVRMTDGYVTAPQCVPSRAGLLSGQNQSRFGLESNPQGNDPVVMERFGALQTIPERLRKAGYATGMAGKWHLGPNDSAKIAEHGFDKVFFKHSNGPGSWNMNLEGRDTAPQEQKGGGYHLDLISTFACSFIERFKDQPFFFYLAYRAPHVPLDPPKAYLDRFPGEMPECRRRALAMLAAVDDGVGRVMETLRKHHLEENTLIFVISDNGAPLKMTKPDEPDGIGWDGSLNDPMNGEKGMLTEGGIRVPFVVYWKGTIPGGQVYSQPVITLDVAATANAVAGLPDDPVLDGVNLLPYLTGVKTGAPHETLYWRWLSQAAIRHGNWKYIKCVDREYLFDMASDAEEKHNMFAAKPEIAKDLHARLARWSDTLIPPGIDGLRSEGRNKIDLEHFSWHLDGKRDLAPVRKPAPKKKV